MPLIHRLTLWIAGAFILGGCLLGGNGDTDTTTLPTNSRTSIQAGHYIGDFAALVPGTQYEPEFVLRDNGSFRFVVSSSNKAVYMLDGKWSSNKDSLIESDLTESYLDYGGYFGIWDSLINDSSSIRAITDSSFERMEYLFFAHNGAGKIDWVTYRKVAFPSLDQGVYEMQDSTDTIPGLLQIKLGGTEGFALETQKNKITDYRLLSKWTQMGTFIMLNPITDYALDTNQVLVTADSIDGWMAIRVKDISKNAFKVWNGIEWNELQKVE